MKHKKIADADAFGKPVHHTHVVRKVYGKPKKRIVKDTYP